MSSGDGSDWFRMSYDHGSETTSNLKPGTVYVTSFVGNIGAGSLYALDGVTGKQKWEFAAKGPIESSPAIGADGTIYFGSDDGNVYAIGP